ncbi:RNA-directed DNA polymerase, eukaryota, reverse transcriptase zinc-binding domain protein [Tanacetum coccineum]
MNINDLVELDMLKGRMIADQYLNKKVQPSKEEISKWSLDMVGYFKMKWNEARIEGWVEEDILSDNEVDNVIANEIVISPNHSPAILTIPTTGIKKAKSFRFANYIVDKPDFIKEVTEGCKVDINGHKMYSLVKRLKHMKPILNKLNWKHGDLTIRVDNMRSALQIAQSHAEKNPHDKSLKVKAIKALDDYNDAMKDEEKLLAQKARIDWLNEGDKNNVFFHKVIKGRRSRNSVHSICDENGVTYEKEDVPLQCVKHFQQFLGKSTYTHDIDLSNEEADSMVKEVSDREIKEALFDIGDNKAPRPDGYSSVFFKKSWEVTGKDVCDAIKEFFSKGQLLGELNSTLITLVPKIQNPQKVSDFRPIACCNVIYKCISKIVTNRIKSYDRRGGPKRCAMKIDLQKAYDTISWKFLEAILINFRFHQKMVGWIMKCVTTAGFSICLNGERHGYFKGGRGLRQGDPMSPYLFTLVMELLTLIIQRRIRRSNEFKYHYKCKEIQLVNLCFTDDLMIFCNGDTTSTGIIKEALREFSEVSCLFPNLNKSSLFFGSMNDAEKQRIMEAMQFNEGSIPTRYLGVPLVTKKLGTKDCKSLIDKIKGRTEDWKCKYMSYARRLMLIAAVLESITKGKAKVAWKHICQPKDHGGLGIKNIEIWNEALLSKHVWNIASKKDTLWVKWIHMLKLKDCSIWNAQVNESDSWNWKCLLEIRDKMAKKMQFEVGNGENISMWYDKWHDSGLLIDKISNIDLYDARMPKMINIKDMINMGNWKWPSEWNRCEFEVMKIRPPRLKQDVKDIIKWKGNDNSLIPFNIKLVMESLSHSGGKVNWGKRNAVELQEIIMEVVKLKMMNLRVKNSYDVRIVAETWGIQFKNLKD